MNFKDKHQKGKIRLLFKPGNCIENPAFVMKLNLNVRNRSPFHTNIICFSYATRNSHEVYIYWYARQLGISPGYTNRYAIPKGQLSRNANK